MFGWAGIELATINELFMCCCLLLSTGDNPRSFVFN